MTELFPGRANRLATLVHQPGGLVIDEAIDAANANLELIRGPMVQRIEVMVERMQAIGAVLESDLDAEALDELYTLANSVVGMAGVFGLECLGQVSCSLCTLIDHLRTSTVWDGRALCVHMDSLRLLRPGTMQDLAQQDAIVAALRRVLETVR